MDFCYAWLRRLAPATPYFNVPSARTHEDAVGTADGTDVGLAEFTSRLSEVFRAAAAALKPGGAFIFTYHHNELTAYAPLVIACLDADLTPTRLYGCPSEMRASVHIHGRNAATVDTVFVLRKAPVPAGVAGTDFAAATVRSVADARLAALRRAGLKPTDADRACVRYSVLAAGAMAHLADSWDPAEDIESRVARALETLDTPTVVTQARTPPALGRR
jgi:adenine-specific DNA methylase